MKKGFFIVGLAVFLIYLIWSNFSLIRKFTGEYAFVPTILPTQNLDSSLGFLNMPAEFQISVAAKDLDEPRVIIFDAKGRMLVSETKANRVSVLEDQDKNGDFEAKRILIENLKSPHGLDFYTEGKITYLYIAETHQVARYSYDLNTGKLTDTAGQNIAFLPGDGQHFTRTIVFGPNFRKTAITNGLSEKETLSPTKLYISVGSSCDFCLESSWKNAAILESDPEGNFTAEFAGGLRNSVFFTFHPETKEIWATEMGRDNLGDDLPPDEINIVKVAGPEHKFGARRFGWPFCYGHQVADKKFKPAKVDRIDIPADCSQTEPAAIELPAHSAPLGLAFVTARNWPKEWQNNLLVAYHGSWNRSEPTGYKIVRLEVDKNGKVSKAEDFISGWLSTNYQSPITNYQTYGRPVDLKFGPDGALYVSDDTASMIYKIETRP